MLHVTILSIVQDKVLEEEKNVAPKPVFPLSYLVKIIVPYL
jgi:hypothetical protein